MSERTQIARKRETGLSALELMGGNFAVILLASALLIVLLIDAYFLNSWVNMRSPTLDFRDPCTGAYPGPSGGFSIALFTVLAIALVGLHLFSRNSFLITGVLALVFVFVQVLIIYHYNSLGNFLAEVLPWYHNLPSPLACNDLTLRDQFYARYKAEDIFTAAGGVQRTLTIMLQFNVVLGGLLAAIIWIAGAIKWILGIILRAVRAKRAHRCKRSGQLHLAGCSRAHNSVPNRSADPACSPCGTDDPVAGQQS